ncbi:MAG TPA: ABC transporter ATP-binding protein [Methylomirabilota bacterium]|nr:ABC transporter ATP-binding protein [Methylomirabilota bacterium]
MGEYAIEVENLVKVFHPRRLPPVRAVDGMSFGVAKGAIFGLLGPNGAGKTTLLKVLTTLLRPTSGAARVLGCDVVRQPLEVRRRIASVLQETAVELFLSVRDNLLTYGRFQGLDLATLPERIMEILERFDIADLADSKAIDLSGGQRRRLQVAKAFLARTPVLFLDEFSTGMDPSMKRAVMSYLRDAARAGRTIVLTTQILSEAEELCDDILIMNHGREVAHGDLHTLKLLSGGVYDVAMTFDRVPDGLLDEIAQIAPLRSKLAGNTIEVSLKMDEAEVLARVAEWARRGQALHVEVSGATLEDIFIHLTGRKENS